MKMMGSRTNAPAASEPSPCVGVGDEPALARSLPAELLLAADELPAAPGRMRTPRSTLILPLLLLTLLTTLLLPLLLVVLPLVLFPLLSLTR